LYASEIARINDIVVKDNNLDTQIYILTSDKLKYTYDTIESDGIESIYDRMYIDFKSAHFNQNINRSIELNNNIIKQIRTGQVKNNTARIVLDMISNNEFYISDISDDNGIKITFKNKINELNSQKNENELDNADTDVSEDITLKNEKKPGNNNTSSVLKNKINGPFDPDARPPLTIKVNNYLSLGGKVNLDLEWSENIEDLDDDEKDTTATFQSELTLAGLITPKPYIDIYAEGRLTDTRVIEDRADEKEEDTTIKLRRAYIYWREFIKQDFDFQIGRQRIKDDREWIFDDNLDALRFYYQPRPFEIELSVSSLLFDGKDDEDKAINYILYSQYKYDRKEKIALFGVARQDRNGSDEDKILFGGSWRGRPFSRNNKVWLDTAVSFIRDEDDDFVSGFGIDGGITRRFKVAWEPNFTIGSAYGSKNFRQTGLQDNNAIFNGKTKFRYYGVLLEPELANLYIGTLGVGVIPRKDLGSSLDLVYHYYYQIDKNDELVDSEIGEDPEGNSKDIGHEIDLIIGSNFSKWIKSSISFGIFFPGDAFSNDDIAYFAEFELQIAFR